MEQLFLQALTSADLQELNADTGLQCLQQLVEQWQQRKEDVAHLNAMLADSHGQIQAAQAQTLQLRQNLVRRHRGMITWMLRLYPSF